MEAGSFLYEASQGYMGDVNSVSNMTQLQSHLGRMQESFQMWEHDVFGSVKQELTALRRELEDVREHSLFAGPSSRERQLMLRISELLARE